MENLCAIGRSFPDSAERGIKMLNRIFYNLRLPILKLCANLNREPRKLGAVFFFSSTDTVVRANVSANRA